MFCGILLDCVRVPVRVIIMDMPGSTYKVHGHALMRPDGHARVMSGGQLGV